MIDKIDAELLPAFMKIVNDTEMRLSTLANRPVSLKLIVNNESKSKKEMQIIMLVCQGFEVTWEEISSPSRKRNVTMARQCYCYLMRKYTTNTLKHIAGLVKRDHTTVIASCETVMAMYFTKDQEMIPTLNSIIEQLTEIETETKIEQQRAIGISEPAV